MCILRSQGYRRDNIQKWRFLMAEQAVRAPLSLYNRKLRPLLYKKHICRPGADISAKRKEPPQNITSRRKTNRP